MRTRPFFRTGAPSNKGASSVVLSFTFQYRHPPIHRRNVSKTPKIMAQSNLRLIVFTYFGTCDRTSLSLIPRGGVNEKLCVVSDTFEALWSPGRCSSQRGRDRSENFQGYLHQKTRGQSGTMYVKQLHRASQVLQNDDKTMRGVDLEECRRKWLGITGAKMPTETFGLGLTSNDLRA